MLPRWTPAAVTAQAMVGHEPREQRIDLARKRAGRQSAKHFGLLPPGDYAGHDFGQASVRSGGLR
jgi:hypothetical protein